MALLEMLQLVGWDSYFREDPQALVKTELALALRSCAWALLGLNKACFE